MIGSCMTVICCMLAGLQPVLVHMSKNKQGKFSFNPVSVNLMVEVSKTLFALVVLIIYVSNLPSYLVLWVSIHTRSACLAETALSSPIC